MNQTITALDAALDAAAPDQERWLAGKEAFVESINSNSDDIEKAYYAALDAAAPDTQSWIAGRDALVLRGVALLPAPSRSFMDRLKDRAPLREKKVITIVDGTKERKTASVGAAVFGIIFGLIVASIIAFIISLLITSWLTILIPILWLIWIAALMAGAMFGYRNATKPKDLVSPIH